jgi:hypothetical protein
MSVAWDLRKNKGNSTDLNVAEALAGSSAGK